MTVSTQERAAMDLIWEGLRDPQLVLGMHSCAKHMGISIWAEPVCEIYHSAS